jgi:iron complex transport system substrate-binding protein
VLRAAAVLGSTALLSACGDNGGSSSARSQGSITVTDQRGRNVRLAGPVSRVVTIPIPAASMLIAIDQSARHLVGMQDASWTAIRDGIMGTMFPDALRVRHDVADQEFAPNVESILTLRPDVVVQWGDHGSGIIKPLENAGLTVLGLSYGTQDDLAAWIRLFSAILGKPGRGRRMLSRMDAELKRIRSQTAAAGPTGTRVLYFLQFAGGLQVAGTKTYNDYYIKLVGASNPASSTGSVQGFAGVDIEQVLAWDPDVVLLGNFDAAVPDDVYHNPVWRGVSAVRSRRVYKVPLGGYRWDPPGQESPLMWRWLSGIVSPQQQAARGLRRHIVDYYEFLYGYRPSDRQMDTMLWTDVNGGSANYRQFHAH